MVYISQAALVLLDWKLGKCKSKIHITAIFVQRGIYIKKMLLTYE
jgi:hypothetical protein